MTDPKKKGPVLWLRSRYRGFQRRRAFDELETFCMFIGYPRSGHTLVGALLDAHPDIVMATGAGAGSLLQSTYSDRQVYSILVDRSRFLANTGRDRGGYFYNVPNQWQGRYRRLRVIGDKLGKDGLDIGDSNRLWERLRALHPVRCRFLHVVRNPFDTISSMRKDRGLSLERKTEIYFAKVAQARRSIDRVGPENVLQIHHETFISDTERQLARVCAFLGVDSPGDYLADCAGIVRSRPNRSRLAAPWTPELVESVKARMRTVPFLVDYRYDE